MSQAGDGLTEKFTEGDVRTKKEIKPGDRVRVLRNRYSDAFKPGDSVGRYLLLAPGDTITVEDVAANYVIYPTTMSFSGMILKKDVELVEDTIDATPMIKPGDQVRIIRNTVGAYTQGIGSPKRWLHPGEIIRVSEAKGGMVYSDAGRGRGSWIPVEDVELVDAPEGTSVGDTIPLPPATRLDHTRGLPVTTLTVLGIGYVGLIFLINARLDPMTVIVSAITTLSQEGRIMTDAWMNLTNEPLVHDAIIRLVAGGGYLALGTLAILFLRNVAVNLGKYGDRLRRLRLEDEARTTERQQEVAKREAEDHDRFVRMEAVKKGAEAFYIAQIVRASLPTEPPNAVQATPQSTSPAKIEMGTWVKFIRDPMTKIMTLEDGGYQSRLAKIGECVRVHSIENGGETIVYDPGRGESLQRVHISRVAPV